MKGNKGTSRLYRIKNVLGGLWEEPQQDSVKEKKGFLTTLKKSFWQYKWELFVMLLMGGFVFYLASSQPYNFSPDEGMRYLICQYIYKHGTLPHGGDPEVIHNIWGTSYAFKPMITCILGGYLMRFMGLFHDDPEYLLMSARFVNVIFAAGFAWYVMRIGKKLFAGVYRIFFVALILLLPQVTYLFSYINNDGIALFATGMILYYWLEGIEHKWDKRSCIGTAIGCSFCILSYYNSYGYLLVTAILFAVTMCLSYQELGNKRYPLMIKRGLFILVIAFILCGWWFIRNAIIYDGDFLGMSVINDIAEIYAQEEYKPSVKLSLYEQGISLKTMLFGETYQWLRETYYSFIAYFGAQQYHLGIDIYQIHKNLLSFSLCGWVVIGIRWIKNFWQRKKDIHHQLTTFMIRIAWYCAMVIVIIIPVLLSLYYSYKNDFQPQGRYIMPMVIPLMFFLAKGTQAIVQFLARRKWAIVIIIPQFYAIFHVFYDAYIKICLPAMGITVPFLDPTLPWVMNFKLVDKIKNFIYNALLPG